MIAGEEKIDPVLPVNRNDPPVTISRKHIMIAEETFLIFGRPGNNEDESVDHFVKTITIAGNHKSILTKRKNTFAKEKNQNDLSGNRTCGNILQEAGNKLKTERIILLKAENVLKEDEINIIIPGNKLKEANSGIQEARYKLPEDQSNLKNLGERMIFVEAFRKNEIRCANSRKPISRIWAMHNM